MSTHTLGRMIRAACTFLLGAAGAAAGGGSPVAPPGAVARPAQRHWVFFADKGFGDQEQERAAISALEQPYNPRAIERRRLRRTAPGLFDARDLPVAQAYLDDVVASGAEVHLVSRWL